MAALPIDLLNDAVALHRAGRIADAAAGYEQLLALEPLHADALHLLGVVRAQQGAPVRLSAELIGRAAALNPASTAYRGNLLKAIRGDWDAAADGLLAAGNVLYDDGQAVAAARCYRTVLTIRPDHAESWGNLAAARRDAGAPADALAPAGRAARLAPGDAEVARLLAALLLAVRSHDAVEAVGRAIRLSPGDAALRFALADAVKIAGRYAEAVEAYRAALCHDPARAEGWFNLGVTLADLGRHEASLPAYARSVRLDPRPVDPRYNLAHAQLITGRWREGWQSFAVRFERGVGRPDRGLPSWQGEAPAGRTILFHGEQGHGDTIQMMRYAPRIAAAGGRVLVECQPALVRLLAACPGVAAAVPIGAPAEADLFLPMMDAPGLFDTVPEKAPDTVPYLRVPAEARRPDLPPAPEALSVGLVWAGDPHTTDARWSHADTRRSIPLSAFSALLEIPGLRLVSLQKGAAAAQAEQPPFAGLIQTSDIAAAGDFADTAALVERLDLVVSVDTAVAHLAGALGVPVWILSRFDGCWRWLLDREDSPWYPTARILRQPAIGVWEPVIGRVVEDVRGLAAAHAASI